MNEEMEYPNYEPKVFILRDEKGSEDMNIEGPMAFSCTIPEGPALTFDCLHIYMKCFKSPNDRNLFGDIEPLKNGVTVRFYDDKGALVWDQAEGFGILCNNHWLAISFTNSVRPFKNGVVVRSYDDEGVLLWDQTTGYGTPRNDDGLAVPATQDPEYSLLVRIRPPPAKEPLALPPGYKAVIEIRDDLRALKGMCASVCGHSK